MKDRFSSAKAQLARLIDNPPSNSLQKNSNAPSLDTHNPSHNNPSSFQPTIDHQSTNKSISETSTCARLDSSTNLSIDESVEGKMQKLMARTKDIEEKLISKLHTSPKNSVLSQNTKIKTDRSMKNVYKIQRSSNQLQNQFSVRESHDYRKLVEILQSVWKQVLYKSFDLRLAEEDYGTLLNTLIQWKEKFNGYQMLREQITSKINPNDKMEVEIPKLIEHIITEKDNLYSELNTVNTQIQRLTQVIQKLDSDRVFYVGEINQRDTKINFLNSEVERLKLNNNCMTEIIYKLQQKKAENQTKVQREVYDHLQQQNKNLNLKLSQIVEENKILTVALTEEISFVRDAILQEVKRKMMLHESLSKAESTIEQLRNMTQTNVGGLKDIVFQKLKINSSICEKINPQNQGKTEIRESKDASCLSHLQGLVNESKKKNIQLQNQKNRLQSALRKQEYERDFIKKKLLEIKKILSEGEVSGDQKISLEAQLIITHEKALNTVYKLKNSQQRNSILQIENQNRSEQFTKLMVQFQNLSKRFMSMRVSKNPAGSEEKVIQLQNANANLAKEIKILTQEIRMKQIVLSSKQQQVTTKDQEINAKQNQNKELTLKIQSLANEIRVLQQSRELEIMNPEKVVVVSPRVQSEMNDLAFELEANIQDLNCQKKHHEGLRRMKSLSICSQQDVVIEDSSNNLYSNNLRQMDQRSQMSDCWNNTSGIQELAVRIDSLGVLGFRIDELFEKYNVRGDISEILSSFLKKLDRMQNVQDLLWNIEQMLESLEHLPANSEQDGGFLRFNLQKMEEIFAETRIQMQCQELKRLNLEMDLDGEILEQLATQSVIDF